MDKCTEVEKNQSNAILFWPDSTVCVLVLFSSQPPEAMSVLAIQWDLPHAYGPDV